MSNSCIFRQDKVERRKLLDFLSRDRDSRALLGQDSIKIFKKLLFLFSSTISVYPVNPLVFFDLAQIRTR